MAAKIAEYFGSEPKSTILEHGFYVKKVERVHDHSIESWVMTIEVRLRINSSTNFNVNGLSASRN